MIKDSNYVTVTGWMVNHLGLKGNALLVYALIAGFCQDGESDFHGSQAYVAEWLGATKGTANRILKDLCDKGLIEKRFTGQYGSQCVSYKIAPVSKSTRSGAKIEPDQCENHTGTGAKIAPDIIDKDTDPIDNNAAQSASEGKTKTKITIKQVLDMLPEELQEVAAAYVEHRKQLKKPMTGHALELAIRHARELAHGDIGATIAILEQSIAQGWQGVYPIKDNGSRGGSTGQLKPIDRAYAALQGGGQHDYSTYDPDLGF